MNIYIPGMTNTPPTNHLHQKIATQSGLIISILIIATNLLLMSLHTPHNSPLVFIQFGLVAVAMIWSAYQLKKHYADIHFFDYFKHTLRTLSTLMFVVIVSQIILFFVFRKKTDPISNVTLIMMKTIFSYASSGLLSAFFTSLIFNTFTKNK